MKRALPILLLPLLALAGCGDEPSDTTSNAPAEQNDVSREAGEAADAIGDAARETGEAARSAAEDAAEAAGPALDRAGEAADRAWNAAREGVNDVTRSAACQTARAADDQDGIEANC